MCPSGIRVLNSIASKLFFYAELKWEAENENILWKLLSFIWIAINLLGIDSLI